MPEPSSHKTIDTSSWKRNRHFQVFGASDYPYIGITTTIDVGKLLAACRDTRTRFFNAFLYAVARAANSVENFRYRLHDGEIRLYDRVDPSFNVLDERDDLFYFAYTTYTRDFRQYNARIEDAKQTALASRTMGNDHGNLHLVYISCLPWFTFTDIIQPLGLSTNDSIPRMIWGKFTEENGKTTIPFSVTGHHGLVDGIHIAKLLDAISALTENPAFLDR